jgi:hypothetical protein
VVGYIYNRAPRQAVLSIGGATIQQRLHTASRANGHGGLPPGADHGTATTAPSQPPPKG